MSETTGFRTTNVSLRFELIVNIQVFSCQSFTSPAQQEAGRVYGVFFKHYIKIFHFLIDICTFIES